MAVLWGVAPCNLACTRYLPDYTAQHSRRQPASFVEKVYLKLQFGFLHAFTRKGALCLHNHPFETLVAHLSVEWPYLICLVFGRGVGSLVITDVLRFPCYVIADKTEFYMRKIMPGAELLILIQNAVHAARQSVSDVN
jgi:hypothetical protein